MTVPLHPRTDSGQGEQILVSGEGKVRRIARDADVLYVTQLNPVETALNLANALEDLQLIAVEHEAMRLRLQEIAERHQQQERHVTRLQAHLAVLVRKAGI